MSYLNASLIEASKFILSYTLKIPKLLPDLFALTKQGRPNFFIIKSTSISSSLSIVKYFAVGIFHSLRTERQSLLLNVKAAL